MPRLNFVLVRTLVVLKRTDELSPEILECLNDQMVQMCHAFVFLVHAVDIWNVIEAFRENGLNTLEPQCEVSVARLETLLSSLYHSLNKRLPPAHQVRAAHCCALLLNWLLAAYCPPGYYYYF